METPHLSAQGVRDLARQHRVARDPRYHARQHHVSFQSVLRALSECFRVSRDERRDAEGRLRHPRGHVAWCFSAEGRILRVDFNFAPETREGVILVVTAMEV